MSDVVSPLLQWLNANPDWAGVATFVISAAESVAIIGTIVPGSITMTAIGTLAGAGIIPLYATIFWAMMGAIVGDGISYWIGHYFKDGIRRMWPFKDNPGVLKKGEAFVHKYGVMSVFIGRFVGPVRALVPLVAGMLGMKPLQFTIANVASAIGWAPAYMLPGILLGAASLELPPDIAVHVMLVLTLISLFGMMCLWFTYKLIQLVHTQTNQLQNAIWQGLKKSRYFSLATRLLIHHNVKKSHGQLNLAFYFVVTSSLFLLLAFYVSIAGPQNMMINETMYHLFRGIRSVRDYHFMIDLTLLGQKQVILPVVVVLFGWLLYCKRRRAAIHTLALGVLAAGSVFVFKRLVHEQRPWGIANNPELFSMPSGHTTLAACVFMGLAFLIASGLPRHRRWPIYTAGILISFAVGISRIYLGAHWFTDVLGAWLLSTAILVVVILSYQRHVEKPVNARSVFLVSFATLILSFGFYHHHYFDTLQNDYAQINFPSVDIDMKAWWEKNNALPSYRTSLFGFPSQRINIEWVGDLKQIEQSLQKEGWSDPPARDWVSTLHRIADVKSTQYLSMISPQYLDKKPALILARRANGVKNLLVLRLWDSSRKVNATSATLWVGIVNVVPRSYNWLFKSQPGEIDVDPTLIFPNKTDAYVWQWKMMLMNQTNGHNKVVSQRILLVRENNSIHKKK